MAFYEILMLKFELVAFNLDLVFIAGQVLNLFPELGNLGVKIQDVPLEDFFFRLDELCFFLLVLDVSLNFFAKPDLDYSDPFLIFGLHLCDNLLIHVNHLGEGLLNPVSFSLEEDHLVMEYFVGDFQVASLAGFLLDLLEVGCLSVEYVF
jgi:hypothetical protein